MDIFKMLDLLEKVESAFSDLYKKLHETYQGNEKASLFFSNLHMEEEHHVQIVRMERRIVQATPKAFSEPYVNLSELNNILEKATSLKEATLELPDLIRQIYDMEKSSAENYLVVALQDTNDDIREFLLNLGGTFAVHRDKIVDFAASLGVQIEDALDTPLRKARIGFSEGVMINKTMTVRSVDISEGGMFLLTGRSFPLDESVLLQFNVLQATISVKAVVQFNITGTGMGVKFTDLAESDRDLIKRYITQRLEEKGSEKVKRVLLVGSDMTTAQENTRIYMNSLLGAGYRIMDISGFEETVNALMKGIDLSCAIIGIETETDTNYYILHYISTQDRYKYLPVLVLTNSQDKQFREKLVRRGTIKLLSRITTSPRRLTDEVKALIG